MDVSSVPISGPTNTDTCLIFNSQKKPHLKTQVTATAIDHIPTPLPHRPLLAHFTHKSDNSLILQGAQKGIRYLMQHTAHIERMSYITHCMKWQDQKLSNGVEGIVVSPGQTLCLLNDASHASTIHTLRQKLSPFPHLWLYMGVTHVTPAVVGSPSLFHHSRSVIKS